MINLDYLVFLEAFTVIVMLYVVAYTNVQTTMTITMFKFVPLICALGLTIDVINRLGIGGVF